MTLLRTAKLALLLTIGACTFQKSLSQPELDRLYVTPLAPPERPLRVFHLGHSLVNHDMPVMLEQLAGTGHEHRSQLGWGTTLKAHWEPGEPINGFEESNKHAQYQDAREAIRSGGFDAWVLTEMVEIRDAIKWFNSPEYLRRWAREARTHRPDTRVYLYETWHRLDDPEGWLERLDKDMARYWEGSLLAKGLAHGDTAGPVHVIPAGQVMAQVVRRIEQEGALPGLASRSDLFARTPDGTPDNIHLNDLGNYVVALTHFAVLYHRSPVGLPHQLKRASGENAIAFPQATARVIQALVWDVVTRYPKTGVQSGKPSSN